MWTCGKCGQTVEDSFGSCWHCGTGTNGKPPADPDRFEEGRIAAAKIRQPAPAEWRGLSLYEVARRQRVLLRLVLVGFAGICGLVVIGVALVPPADELPVWYQAAFLVFQIGYSLIIVVVMFRFFKAIVGSSAWLYVVLVLLPIPLLGLGVTLGFNVMATRALKANGIPVGLLGVRKQPLEVLARNSRK